MDIKLNFLGAAKNVTGSCYLVESGRSRVLIDCGIYQERHLKDRNWQAFPVPPGSVDAVLLTHAHLDHCGLLPKLVKDGFAGRIFCTSATADIAGIVMLDSGHIQEEDARIKQQRHEREGREGPHPEVPLYTVADAEAVLPRFSAAPYAEWIPVADGIEALYRDSGHILGSASILVRVSQGAESRTILFSGDVGRWDSPIIRDPARWESADYVVVESTYGNRVHKDNALIPDQLARIVSHTARQGGNIVIPSFSVERAQELLFHLRQLLEAKRIPPLTVFVDSPMAIKVTEVFRRHPDLFDEETMALLDRGKHPCELPNLRLCRTSDESKAIRHHQGSSIIIAGSGMCTGGRIKHHLKDNIGRSDSTILFVGYQAVGTLGRIILDGVDRVRIHGESFPVEARVNKINGFSAHADRNELLRWLSGLREAPRQVFVTHGEPAAADEFAEFVRLKKGWKTSVAEYQEPAQLT